MKGKGLLLCKLPRATAMRPGAWIFKVENITAFEELLDAEAYEAMTKEG